MTTAGIKTPIDLGIVVGLVIGLTAWWHTPPRAQPVAERPFIGMGTAVGRPTHIPGELLVKFRPHVSREQIAAFRTTQDATVLGYHKALDIYRLEIQGDIRQASAAYHSSPMVQWAQPNRILYPSLVPNDPLYQDVQGRPTDLQKWYLGPDNLNAEAAWDLTTGRSDVVIAIIDTGVGLEHPDLADNIWVNSDEIPGNDRDDDNNGFVDDINGYDFCSGPFNSRLLCRGMDNNPNPERGDGIDNDRNDAADDNVAHGTFVAGTAAAIGDNRRFGAGAAHRVKVMALKVFVDDGGARTDRVLAAIDYAIENGADVINISLGGPPGEDCLTFDRAFETAITAAFNAGIVVVVAGNDNALGPGSPASCTHAMAVGSSGTGIAAMGGPGFPGEIDERASFTNFGRSPSQRFGVDVVAPGVRLLGPIVCSQADVLRRVAGCNRPGDFTSEIASGTSFSSPLVSGLAALVISRARDLDQDLSPSQVRAIIQDTTQDLPNDLDDTPDAGPDWDGQGRVDFLTAVLAVGGPEVPGEVSCNLTMSQPSYSDREPVVAMEIRLTNSGLEPVPVEVKIWRVFPDLTTDAIDLLNITELLPESVQDFGPQRLFRVTEETPRGNHEINCRLLDPVTGETLSSDINPFEIR